jgi:hypothetical protein
MDDQYRNFIADDPWNNCCSGMMLGADGSMEPSLMEKKEYNTRVVKILALIGLIAVGMFAYNKFMK